MTLAVEAIVLLLLGWLLTMGSELIVAGMVFYPRGTKRSRHAAAASGWVPATRRRCPFFFLSLTR